MYRGAKPRPLLTKKPRTRHAAKKPGHMQIYSNCAVEKLREYSKCYGKPEVIEVPFIKEDSGSIYLYNNCGRLTRTMRKGTKLLISWKGEEITERAYKGRVKKALTEEAIEKEAQRQRDNLIFLEAQKKEAETIAAFEKCKDRFAKKWLESNPNLSISNREANSFAWKKQNYLGIETPSITTLRGCIKRFFNSNVNYKPTA